MTEGLRTLGLATLVALLAAVLASAGSSVSAAGETRLATDDEPARARRVAPAGRSVEDSSTAVETSLLAPRAFDAPTSASGSVGRGGSITIKSRWVYQDDDGGWHPMRRVWVELKDNNPCSPDSRVAVKQTDDDGRVTFVVNNDDANGRDPYLKVWGVNDAAYVKTGDWLVKLEEAFALDTALYCMQTEEIASNVSDGFYRDIGTWTTSNTNQRKAWQAIDACLEAQRWVRDNTDPAWKRSDQVCVIFPSTDWVGPGGGAHFRPGAGDDCICLPSWLNYEHWGPPTVHHEYAHAVMYSVYGALDWPVDDVWEIFQDHTVTEETTDEFALQEGFAEFLECAVEGDPDNLNTPDGQNIEFNEWYDSGDMDGARVEGSVASMFWDIIDPKSVEQEATSRRPDRKDDLLDLPFDAIFDTLKAYKPKNMGEFWEGWKKRYPDLHTRVGPLCNILYYNGFNRDTYAPFGGLAIYGTNPLDPTRLDPERTLSTEVALKLEGRDYGAGRPVQQMRLATSTASWGPWQSFPGTDTHAWVRPYHVSPGSGVRTVYVQYKDDVGNISPVLSDDIVLEDRPNLVAPGVVVPSGGYPGSTIQVTHKVANVGVGAAGPSTTKYYLVEYPAHVPTDDDYYLGERRVSGLESGAEVDCQVTLMLPHRLIGHDMYYLYVWVDANEEVDEIYETNAYGYRMSIEKRPDLAIDRLTGPSMVDAGGTIAVDNRVINLGNAHAPTSTVSFYLSRDPEITPSDLNIGSRIVPTLYFLWSPSGNHTWQDSAAVTNLTVPSSVLEGSYYIGAIADSAGVVTECTENNNTRSFARLYVRPPGAAAPPAPLSAGAWVTDGIVYAVVPSDDGGAYIGGDFGHVGPPSDSPTATSAFVRNNVARLRADGSVDPDFAPDVGGPVYEMVRNGPVVVIGGDFDSVGGQVRHNLASVWTDTRGVTDWNPDANAPVSSIAVADSAIYVGGHFTSMSAVPRNRAAAFTRWTGDILGWNPNANAQVAALAVDGSRVLAGGDFTVIGGQPRSHVAALDTSAGVATAWDPSVAEGGGVRAIAPYGSSVYVGGFFKKIGGQTRYRLAELDATTGQATAWNPSSNNGVYAIVPSGGTIYVGGFLTTIGGSACGGAAALDPVGSLPREDWNPNADGAVFAIAHRGSTCWLGGAFSRVAGQPRRGVAALGTLADPLDPPLPPGSADLLSASISCNRSRTTVPYGSTATIWGELNDEAGADIGDASRIVALRKSGNYAAASPTYSYVRDADYWADLGTYRVVTPRLTSNTAFHLRFGGDDTYLPCQSRNVVVLAQARMYMPVMSTYAPRRYRIFTVAGCFRPGHTGKTRIEFYRKVNSSYRIYRAYYATNAKLSSALTKYTLRTRLPYRGYWRLRARHLDSGHARSYSSWRYFRVR